MRDTGAGGVFVDILCRLNILNRPVQSRCVWLDATRETTRRDVGLNSSCLIRLDSASDIFIDISILNS